MSDWKRKVPGVDWRDVWVWFETLRTEHGLWGVVQLQPPLPSRVGTVACVVVVELTRYLDGNRTTKLVRWREVKRKHYQEPAVVALELVSGIAMQLDAEAWEAERDAVVQGRLF